MAVSSRVAPLAAEPDVLSWSQQATDLSLRLILRTGIRRDAPVLDVDGGLSPLTLRLAGRGFSNLSGRAFADLSYRPRRRFQLWHHCLASTALVDPTAYASALRASLAADAWVILGAPMLDAEDDERIGAQPGPGFRLLETHGEILEAPNGAEELIRFHIFQRD